MADGIRGDEGAPDTTGTASTRVAVTLRGDDQERLDYIAETTGLSRNDSIRKAIATQAWVSRTLARGHKVLVTGDRDQVREVVWP